MKKLDVKIKPDVLLTVGTVILAGAQLLLTNKKEASDKAALKAEIVKELLEKAPKSE